MDEPQSKERQEIFGFLKEPQLEKSAEPTDKELAARMHMTVEELEALRSKQAETVPLGRHRIPSHSFYSSSMHGTTEHIEVVGMGGTFFYTPDGHRLEKKRDGEPNYRQ